MITKRVRIVYAFLFLFTFTFALSFTLAQPPDEKEPCCTVYCSGHPEQVAYHGWEDIHYPWLGCQVPYNPEYETCLQMVYQCPPE